MGGLKKPSLASRTILLVQVRVDLVRNLDEERSRRSRYLVGEEWFNHHYVGTEHLILAVCSFSDCRAAKVLADLGTPSVEVCRDVLQLLGHQDRFDQWLADQPGTS